MLYRKIDVILIIKSYIISELNIVSNISLINILFVFRSVEQPKTIRNIQT